MQKKRDPKRDTDGERLGLGRRETQGPRVRDRDPGGIRRKVEKRRRGAGLRARKEVREKGHPAPSPTLLPGL